MAIFKKTAKKKLRALLGGPRASEREWLQEILCSEYSDEVRMSAQLKEHARKMPYAQFRDRLLEIASEEDHHAQWLGEKLEALGGHIPEVPKSPWVGRNSWECLVKDLEAENRCCANLEDWLPAVESMDPDFALGLRKMCEEERNHRDEIREMLMRSDPQASTLH